MKSLFAQLCTYWSGLSHSTFTVGLNPCQSCLLLSSILMWTFFTLWVTRDLVCENVISLYLTKKGSLIQRDYIVINCCNRSFCVYAHSKECSQNFICHSFSLFKLPKNSLGKHLQYKNCSFIKSSIKTLALLIQRETI